MKSSFALFARFMICLTLLFGVFGSAADVFAVDIQSVSDTIVEGCVDSLAEIDLKQYELSADELKEIFFHIRNRGLLPWYVKNSYQFVYLESNKGNFVSTIKPDYYAADTYNRNLYEQKICEIIAETVYPGMSDRDIALSVHDYLAVHCAYDESHTYYSGYDALVYQTAVCQGYAEAYMDILNRCGVPCMMVSSDEMDHRWNLVQIEGLWYHVDVTWDDPSPDRFGRVFHQYFLLSDSKISDETHEHFGWSDAPLCSDTTNDQNQFWHETDSRIIYLDHQSYVYRYDQGNKSVSVLHVDSSGAENTLFSIESEGLTIHEDGNIWYYHHSGLSFWNGKLYVSDPQHVYAFDPDGTESECIFTYDADTNRKYIYGCNVSDGKLFLTLSTHDKELSQLIRSLDDTVLHAHSYTEHIIAPSCISDGYKEHVCTCGLTYFTDPVSSIGHRYEKQDVQGASIFRKDDMCVMVCSLCGTEKTELLPERTFFAWLSECKAWLHSLFENIGKRIDGTVPVTKEIFIIFGVVLLAVWLLAFMKKR